MAPKWIVPGCESNYDATKDSSFQYITVFRFPKEETLRYQWIRNIPRTN